MGRKRKRGARLPAKRCGNNGITAAGVLRIPAAVPKDAPRPRTSSTFFIRPTRSLSTSPVFAIAFCARELTELILGEIDHVMPIKKNKYTLNPEILAYRLTFTNTAIKESKSFTIRSTPKIVSQLEYKAIGRKYLISVANTVRGAGQNAIKLLGAAGIDTTTLANRLPPPPKMKPPVKKEASAPNTPEEDPVAELFT